jgi:CRISPR-associated protein Cas5h
MKLYSFIIKSDFGMFKKPDINDKIFITYNMIHKPVLLGILGAIAGFNGYAQPKTIIENQVFPDYYEILKDIRVSIEPIDSENGVFKKDFIIYNNTVNGKTSNITEQTLINPSYKIYLELDDENKYQKMLINNLRENKAIFLPYMGKNDFSLYWWDIENNENTFKEYTILKEFIAKDRFKVSSIILKDDEFILKKTGYKERTTDYFYYFERLPVNFDENLKQYNYNGFLYTNVIFKQSTELNNLYEFDEGVICLF